CGARWLPFVLSCGPLVTLAVPFGCLWFCFFLFRAGGGVLCGVPLGSLWCALLCSYGVPYGSLWLPMAPYGALWCPVVCPMVPYGVPMGCVYGAIWGPVVSLWCPMVLGRAWGGVGGCIGGVGERGTVVVQARMDGGR